MSKSPTPYLNHILEETSFLLSVFKNSDQTLAGFINDETLKRAVVRSIEIIGEASKKFPLPSSSIILLSNGKIWLECVTDSFIIT